MTAKRAKTFCSVFGCLNNDASNPDLSFFRIPTEQETRLQWLRLIDREDLSHKSTHRSLVCEVHFKAEDISLNSHRKLLRKNRSPCLHLPNNKKDEVNNKPVNTTTTAATQTDIPTCSVSCETQKTSTSEDITQTTTSLSADKMSSKSTFLCNAPPKEKRRNVSKEDRVLIVNVYNYLREEYIFTMKHKDCSCDLSHLRNILRRTADATNFTMKAVANAINEDKRTNKQKIRNKMYTFEKGKKATSALVGDVDKIIKEIEVTEAQTLADAKDEDIENLGEERIVVLTLGTAQTSVENKGMDKNVKICQPAEVKKEAEEEQTFLKVEDVEITWNETEIKTEVDVEEDVTWEDAEIKTEVEEELIS